MANFKPFSRYTNGIVTFTRDNKHFLVLRKPLNLKEDNSDVLVTVTQDICKRPDLVSYKAYNTPDLWWVIYEYNGIRNPLLDLKPGQILRIPQLERVNEAISNLGT